MRDRRCGPAGPDVDDLDCRGDDASVCRRRRRRVDRAERCLGRLGLDHGDGHRAAGAAGAAGRIPAPRARARVAGTARAGTPVDGDHRVCWARRRARLVDGQALAGRGQVERDCRQECGCPAETHLERAVSAGSPGAVPIRYHVPCSAVGATGFPSEAAAARRTAKQGRDVARAVP